jgi:hypothetical protein
VPSDVMAAWWLHTGCTPDAFTSCGLFVYTAAHPLIVARGGLSLDSTVLQCVASDFAGSAGGVERLHHQKDGCQSSIAAVDPVVHGFEKQPVARTRVMLS